MSLQWVVSVCFWQILLLIGSSDSYPELRSDLQNYQDNSRWSWFIAEKPIGADSITTSVAAFSKEGENIKNRVPSGLWHVEELQCYPDIGEWVLMYRNYYNDKDLGGSEKCVKYNRYGTYKDYSTQCTFRFGKKGFINGTLTLSSSPCYSAKNNKTFVPSGGACATTFSACPYDCMAKAKSCDLPDPLLNESTCPANYCYNNGDNDPRSTKAGDGRPESFHAIYMDCDSCFVARHPYAGDGQGCTLWRRYDSLGQPNDCCEFIYDENCGTSPKYIMYDSSCRW